MAITDYASIRTEVNNHTERAYSQAQIDTFIGLFEADANIYLGPNYARETTTTITIFQGSAALPAGFIRPIALSHATYGVLGLKTWDALIAYNPTNMAGIPTQWAILGSNLKIAYAADDDFTLDYEAVLAPLSGTVTTNWLLAKAPQAYFWGVMAQAGAFEENLQAASTYGAKAQKVIEDLSSQATVAQFGRASVTLPGSTP